MLHNTVLCSFPGNTSVTAGTSPFPLSDMKVIVLRRTTIKFLCFSGDKCNAGNNSLNVVILHACCQEYPTSGSFENVPSSTIYGGGACNCATGSKQVPGMLSQVRFLGLFNSWPSTTWAIMCAMWDKSKQVLSRLHSSSWWQEGESLNFWICLLLLKGTQSVPLPSVLPSCLLLLLLSFIYFYASLQSSLCSLSWCVLLSCCWWCCWTQVLDSLGNDSQTSWWQNRHFHHSWLVSQRGGQTSIPHAYRQILFFVLLFSLVGVMFLFVDLMQLQTYLRIHSLSTNLSPTSGTLKLLSGTAGVFMVLLMLFVSYPFVFLFVIVCYGWCFSKWKGFLFSHCMLFLNEQTLWQVAR